MKTNEEIGRGNVTKKKGPKTSQDDGAKCNETHPRRRPIIREVQWRTTIGRVRNWIKWPIVLHAVTLAGMKNNILRISACVVDLPVLRIDFRESPAKSRSRWIWRRFFKIVAGTRATPLRSSLMFDSFFFVLCVCVCCCCCCSQPIIGLDLRPPPSTLSRCCHLTRYWFKENHTLKHVNYRSDLPGWRQLLRLTVRQDPKIMDRRVGCMSFFVPFALGGDDFLVGTVWQRSACWFLLPQRTFGHGRRANTKIRRGDDEERSADQNPTTIRHSDPLSGDGWTLLWRLMLSTTVRSAHGASQRVHLRGFFLAEATYRGTEWRTRPAGHYD